MTAVIHHGDCLDIMRTLPENSVDAVITSPPYAEQRKTTYGGIPEKDYPAWTVAWMAEAKRLLKPTGSVLLNIRPHIKDGQISDYTLLTRLAVRQAGWKEVDELIWHKSNGMPTGSRHKPRRSWESIHWFAKVGQPYCDAKANGKPSTRSTDVHRYGQHTRNADWDHYDGGSGTRPEIARCQDIVTLSKGQASHGHPAPYPVELAEWMLRLVTPVGGTVLDPFSGSASTGVACLRNGMNYIGLESKEEYIAPSRERLAAETEKQLEELL